MSKLESLMQRARGGGNGVLGYVCVCVCVCLTEDEAPGRNAFPK